MARIRTIKPEFFRHELLQDLERENPHLHPMLVFSALFGHCDKQGIFLWSPRQLSLDILPFIWAEKLGVELGSCLELLLENKLVKSYEFEGKRYGYIPSFLDHQQINTKEKEAPTKMPELSELTKEKVEDSSGSCPGQFRDSSGTVPEFQEGKGREGKGKEDKNPPLTPPAEKTGQIATTTNHKRMVELLHFNLPVAVVTPAIHQELRRIEEAYPMEEIEQAFATAGESGAKNLKYVKAILERKDQGHGENQRRPHISQPETDYRSKGINYLLGVANGADESEAPEVD